MPTVHKAIILSGLLLPALSTGAMPAAALAQDAQIPEGQSDSVVVKGRKKPVAKKIDKTVHDVSNIPKAANGSAQDVLQSTPDVSVTADGQIAVKGNRQVTVLINGKPTAILSGPDRALALQTMNGSDIASIEVITNPSAAYNASGGAILNIVLKKDRKPGTHGQLRASASDQGLWNATLSGDATKGRLSLHASASFRRDGTLRYRQSEIDWTNIFTGATGRTTQASKVFVRRIVTNANAGFDADLSDTDSLSGSVNYYFRRSKPWFDALNTLSEADTTQIYHRISYGPNQQSNGGATLSYSHQDGDEVLKAALQHSGTIALIDKSYRDEYVTPLQATRFGHGLSKSVRRLDQFTLDWSRPSSHGQWGAGIDLQQQTDDLTNYQAAIDPAAGTETPDPNVSNRYRADTTLNAAYITDQIIAGRWQWLLGARYEAMTLHLTAPGFDHSGDWQAVNPSLHVKYSLTDMTRMTFSARRSLQRPDARDLNPFTTYLDARSLSRGNTDLKPQILTAYELTLDSDTKTLGRSLAVFYRDSRDTITDTRTITPGPSGETLLLTSQQNGGRARSAGVTASADWTPNPTWRLRGDGGVFTVALRTPDLTGMVDQEGVSAYLNLALDYSKGRNAISIDAHAQSAGITPLGRYGATNSVNLTWKRDMGSGLSLTLNASDLFDGAKRTYGADTVTFRKRGIEHFIARRIYIGVVKKIG